MFLAELSLCDSLQSVFRYAPPQGNLVIKSQRNPLFSAVSVYEALKVPKEGWGKQTIHGIPLSAENPKLLEQTSPAPLPASRETVWP